MQMTKWRKGKGKGRGKQAKTPWFDVGSEVAKEKTKLQGTFDSLLKAGEDMVEKANVFLAAHGKMPHYKALADDLASEVAALKAVVDVDVGRIDRYIENKRQLLSGFAIEDLVAVAPCEHYEDLVGIHDLIVRANSSFTQINSKEYLKEVVQSLGAEKVARLCRR